MCERDGARARPDPRRIFHRTGDFRSQGRTCQVKAAGLSEETATAGANLDTVVDGLASKFAEGTDYFQVLVDVFRDEMRSEKSKHLKFFYMIVPPLTRNWVEHVMSWKDKMSKRGKEASFTDDGFAIGLAYVLRLLDQDREFDSLHWFESVARKFEKDADKLRHTMGDRKKKEDNEVQTLQLTQRRLQHMQIEFDLLYYSFSGSRIFFRDH